MRIIEFRGKSVKSGRWYVGNLQTNSIYDTWISELDCGEGDRGFFENVKQETVGQFTGLYDSKKNKIFEGDILKDLRMGYNTKVSFIGNGFVSESNSGYVGLFETELYEVIGNIYDNPEFLNFV